MSEDPTEALLHVARDIIAKRGYVGLTMRTAAAAAGVTPEVARRYYRNRDALFAAALRLPDDPFSAIPALLAPGIEGMGEQLVRFTLDTLRDPQARDDLMSMARAGVSAGQAVFGLQEFIEVGVVDRIAGTLGVPDARMRASLITSYLMGVAIMRYGVRLEPLASASDEEVIRMVAPVIQDLLDPRRPIPGSARDRARAAAKSGKAELPEVRRRAFDPDPAATRAAKQRAEAEAVDQMRAEARRVAARSAAKQAARSTARPAASSAARHAAEPTAEPGPGADPGSTAPESRPTTTPAAEGRAEQGREVPAEGVAASGLGTAGADAEEGAASSAAAASRAGATKDVAARSARTTEKAKPGRPSAAKPKPVKKPAAPAKAVPSSAPADPGPGTHPPAGAGTSGRDSAAARDQGGDSPYGDQPPDGAPAADE